MKSINWKIRFKNPQFILQIIVSVFVPILGYTGLSAPDLTSWAILLQVIVGAIKNPYVLLIIFISVYNAIQDPTTAGITDSIQALTYTEPKKEGN